MERITSAKNHIIQSMRALKDGKNRQSAGLMLAEGEKLVGEALTAGLRVPHALIMQSKIDAFAPLAARLSARGATVYEAPDSLLQSVGDSKTAQGIIAVCAIPPPADLKNPPDRIVALDEVQDPGNVGAIWRTADAAGFGAMLATSGCADPFCLKAQRAAMGSGFRIPLSTGATLEERLRKLRGMGYSVIVSALDGADFRTFAPPEKLILVIGNESRGVSASVRALAGHTLTIPMRGGAESFNAAVAAGILLYHLGAPSNS